MRFPRRTPRRCSTSIAQVRAAGSERCSPSPGSLGDLPNVSSSSAAPRLVHRRRRPGRRRHRVERRRRLARWKPRSTRLLRWPAPCFACLRLTSRRLTEYKNSLVLPLSRTRPQNPYRGCLRTPRVRLASAGIKKQSRIRTARAVAFRPTDSPTPPRKAGPRTGSVAATTTRHDASWRVWS